MVSPVAVRSWVRWRRWRAWCIRLGLQPTALASSAVGMVVWPWWSRARCASTRSVAVAVDPTSGVQMMSM